MSARETTAAVGVAPSGSPPRYRASTAAAEGGRYNPDVAVRAIAVAALLGTFLVVLVAPTLAASQPPQSRESARRDTLASGSSIPPRPEQLRYTDTPFPSPDGDRYRLELSNGVVVYVVEDHTTPLVDVSLALPVGELYDTPDHLGTASLTAAMLRRGGAGARDASAFDEQADFLAVEIDSVGGVRRSGLTLDTPSRVLEPALDLLADVLLRPRFEAERVDNALQNMRASLRTRNDDPLDVLDVRWRMLMHGKDHPLARQIAPRHLAALDRTTLAAFHARHWSPRGAVIAVSGDVDTATLLRQLEERFGSAAWPPSAPAAPEQAQVPSQGPAAPPVITRTPTAQTPASSPPTIARTSAAPGIYFVEHTTPQVKLRLGHDSMQRRSWDESDAWAAMLMTEVLDGGGTVSRLRSRLRTQESLVYRVRTSFGIGMPSSTDEPGLFEVFLEVDPQHAGSAVALVIDEIERLRREPVSDVELDLARRSLVDAFPLLFDGAEQLAGRLAEDALLGRPHEYWTLYRRRLAAVTPADVQRVARQFLRPRELRLLWVGPAPPRDAFARLGIPGEPVRLPALDPETMEPAGKP